METFRCTYSTDSGFLLRSAQNFKKCFFLENLRTITQEGNMEARHMILLFSCGPFVGPFWPVKYLHFGQELLIRTTQHTFLENRHHEVTKNPYHVLFPEGSQKKISAQGLTLKHMCSLLLILIKPRARDVTPDNKFIFLVSTTKNALSENFVLVSITVSTSPNIERGVILSVFLYLHIFVLVICC